MKRIRRTLTNRNLLLVNGESPSPLPPIPQRQVAADLRQPAGYFRDNQRRGPYQERRGDNYPIGRSTAESGCKQFRARFTAAGTRWSRSGAEILLPVRAAILSHGFDTLRQAWHLPIN